MNLRAFDFLGQTVNDEESEAVIREGDPWRWLIRFSANGRMMVHARINRELYKACLPHRIVRAVPRYAGHLIDNDRPNMLSIKGRELAINLREAIAESAQLKEISACFLALQHLSGGEVLYFVAENGTELISIINDRCAHFGLDVDITQFRVEEIAAQIWPRETIYELNLQIPPSQRVQRTEFDFMGQSDSLMRLRQELERRDFLHERTELLGSLLYMSKVVAVDSKGFNEVLAEVVHLARAHACMYRGTETIDFYEQFSFDRPIPGRFIRPAVGLAGAARRLFGLRRL